MIQSQMCVSSESENRKFSKTDYLDIAVYGRLQADGTLQPIVFELLGKARELADQTSVKVSLVMIGSHISRYARDLFRYGADRIFVYDDPLYENLNSDIARSILEHFLKTINLQSCFLAIIMGESDTVESVFRQNKAAFACRQAIFDPIRIRIWIFRMPLSIQNWFISLISVLSLFLYLAEFFNLRFQSFPQRGTLSYEQPSSLSHQEKNTTNKNLDD